MNSRVIRMESRGTQALPLGEFPVVDDFAVTVSNDEARTIVFTSATRGNLAGFPAWENADRDLRHLVPADVPIGSIDEPFDERDEEWRIVIFEHAGSVYILEGTDPNATEFPVWFRVPSGRYMQAWAALIDFYNPITPLDEKE